jgi:hypothetical protein
MKLKTDEEIGQKNKIILSLQNSLSKMKTEIGTRQSRLKSSETL